jgi:hypothetical protein
VLLAVGIVAGYWWLKGKQVEHETEDETGCLAHRGTPNAVMFMVDTTDRLSPANAEYVISAIRDVVGKLPRYSRVIVVPFGDDTATPLRPIFSRCLPGRAEDAGLDESGRFIAEAYKGFEGSIADLSNTLRSQPDAPSSPITQQVIRVASDPELHWQGDKRTLVVFTDGLESSIYWTKKLQLKDPTPHILEGVDVEYHEVGNPRAKQLQTDDLREKWKEWFAKAGANVRVTAPGFPSQ